jgi:hypothetical protein
MSRCSADNSRKELRNVRARSSAYKRGRPRSIWTLELQAGGRGQWAFLSRFRRDPTTGVLQVESR